jgi:cell wall-associated NlpC family hydrolase
MALVLGLVVIGGAGQDTTSGSILTVADLAAQTCVVTGAVGGLDSAQATNAEEIVSAAMTASNENQAAVRIAVMVADTESGLRNVDHGTQDSVGLFQQRPSQGWGTATQLMDPAYATDAFIRRLLAVAGWQHMAPWRAAQAVQRSASATGSNYKAKWAAAGQITAEVLTNGTAASSCGQGSGTLAGPPATHGLPAGYTVAAGTPPEHARVVAFALGQLGKPYVWGAAGPSAYDCSGLTQAAWATVGVHLDHYTGDQQHQGVAVDVTALVPGDLVLTPGSDAPGPGVAGHVGIYLGDSLVLSAIDPQDGVAVQTWATFVSGGLIAIRDPAPGE